MRSTGTTQRTWALLATTALFAASLSLGCAFGEIRLDDPLDRELSLEEAQQRYTVLVRWNDVNKAAKFVSPDTRAEYLANFPNFRHIRITEFESDRVTIDEGKKTATVEVRYYVYTPATPMESVITETQQWHRDPGVGNYWFVRSSFAGLQELVALQDH